jgi:hypothetical protein
MPLLDSLAFFFVARWQKFPTKKKPWLVLIQLITNTSSFTNLLIELIKN